jgi:NAD-dependent dihydropyrimidine dehydrogenase PreA subunit
MDQHTVNGMEWGNGLYRKLQSHLDGNMPFRFPETESGVELDLLTTLFSPEEARIALEISSLPESLKTIEKRVIKSGIDPSGLDAILDSLEGKGAILGHTYWIRMGYPKGRYYSKALFVIGMYEFQAGRLSRNLSELSHRYLEQSYIPAMLKNKTMQMRTIPIQASLTAGNTVASYDNIREILTRTERPIVVIPCVCRETKGLLGTPCRTGVSETCLLLNEIAEMYIDFGRGRVITKDEALGIIDTAEKKGLVIQPSNNQKPSHICCCCSCCCEDIGNIRKISDPSRFFHSNFYSSANGESCKGCGICVKRCPMEAVTLADKTAVIDRDRCIGCGVCVPACPENSMALVDKTRAYIPPKSTSSMYKKIMMENHGTLGLMKIILKYMIGIKL